MKKKGAKTEADMDWENRALCIDESCIGTIGLNGRCSVCGKPLDSMDAADIQYQEAQVDNSVFEDEPPVEIHNKDEVVEMVEADEDETIFSSDMQWENRTLCSDESCIGAIGPDGKCKECGKTL